MIHDADADEAFSPEADGPRIPVAMSLPGASPIDPTEDEDASASPTSDSDAEPFDVATEFIRLFARGDRSLAAVGISVLLKVLRHSRENTIQGLLNELKQAKAEMEIAARETHGKYHSTISLISGCELFIRCITRQTHAQIRSNVQLFKKRFLERGQRIAQLSIESRSRIASVFEPFVREDMKVLLVGYSSVALHTLVKYREVRFEVFVPEGRPDGTGYMIANELVKSGIQVTVLTDSAVAHVIQQVDFVLSGAEGVVENGGIINRIGTYQIAILAKVHHKPVYVTVESYKFVRKYPLRQRDMEIISQGRITRSKYQKYVHIPSPTQLRGDVKLINPVSDFTPPKYITFLITDLGILTPSGISDELIKLYS